MKTNDSVDSKLVDATILIERIITHIDSNKDTPYLGEQIALALMNAREIGPRLAKIAGCRWLPNMHCVSCYQTKHVNEFATPDECNECHCRKI